MYRVVSLLTLLGLVGCGDDASDGSTPSTTTLTGWWFTETDNGRTVFGFVPYEELGTVDLEGLTVPPGSNVALVYTEQLPDYQPYLSQVTTYEVRDSVLAQTVIGDVAAPPGTMYETQILSFDGATMQLESSNSATGSRVYTKTERCPAEGATGWGVSFIDPMETSGYARSLSVGADGTIHGTWPDYKVRRAPCQSPVVAMPPGGYMHAAHAIRGDEVHLLLERTDGALDYFWRAGDGAWQGNERISVVPPSGSPAYQLRLFVDGDDLVSVLVRTDGTNEVHRRTASGWTNIDVSASPPVRAVDVAAAPDGSIVMLSAQGLRRISGTTVTDTPLPARYVDTGELSGGIVVDSQNRVHATWNNDELSGTGLVYGYRGIYGIFDGTTWTTFDLGPAAYPHVLAPSDDALYVVHANAKAAWPGFSLTELALDGTIRSSEIILDRQASGGGSPPNGMRITGARGEDGTIVASVWNLNFPVTLYRPGVRATTRPNLALAIEVRGTGRVYTDDGRVDCTGTCTYDIPWGTRLFVRTTGTGGAALQSSPCFVAPGEDGCWLDILPQPAMLGLNVTYTFAPPP